LLCKTDSVRRTGSVLAFAREEFAIRRRSLTTAVVLSSLMLLPARTSAQLKQFGLQSRDEVRDVRRVQNAIDLNVEEEATPVAGRRESRLPTFRQLRMP